MKPDLLICWIKHCDYPLFREFIKKHREFFGKIIIYWSEHFRHMYYDKFIKNDLRDLNITFLSNIEYKYGEEDWRNVATNHMLKFSNSEWVCSIEQDFFVRDWDKILNDVREAMRDNDLIGWMQESNGYIHPSFWFIKRFILDSTSKDFAAHGKHDHFGWITEDVKKFGCPIKSLQSMGYKDFEDFFHLGGVNQNYLEGLKDGYTFHRPEIFRIYNYFSMKVKNQDPQFLELCIKIAEKLPGENPEESQWKPFFV